MGMQCHHIQILSFLSIYPVVWRIFEENAVVAVVPGIALDQREELA